MDLMDWKAYNGGRRKPRIFHNLLQKENGCPQPIRFSYGLGI